MSTSRRLLALTLALLGCGPRAIGPDEQADGESDASESGGSETASLDLPTDCSDEPCGPYEECSPEGSCELDCAGQLPVMIDPPGSCQITLDPKPPEPLIPYMYVLIDGEPAYHTSDCADEGAPADEMALVWLNAWTLQLCEQACLAAHSSESLELAWDPLWCQGG